MDEPLKYEVTISIRPIPSRTSGVLGYSVPILKESNLDIMDYGKKLAEIIQDFKEKKTSVK